jgi:hypothetical protein
LPAKLATSEHTERIVVAMTFRLECRHRVFGIGIDERVIHLRLGCVVDDECTVASVEHDEQYP